MLNFVCIKTRPFLFFFLLVNSIALKNAHPQTTLSSAQYSDLSNIAEQVMMGCKPPECTIVALGRSPSPIVEFIQAAFPEQYQIVELPLSSFRYNTHAQTSDRFVHLGDRALNEAELAKLYQHFKNFLPSAPKKILLLDFTASGRPVFSASQYIERFYAQLHHQVELLPTAIINPNDSLVESVFPENIQRYRMKKFAVIAAHELGSLFDLAAFDDVAKYAEFNFLKDESVMINDSEKRAQFLAHLKEHMDRDPKLKSQKLPKVDVKTLSNCIKKQF